MEELIKQDKSKSHKEFEKLLSQDLGNRKLKEGEIITGVVSNISKKHIFVEKPICTNYKEYVKQTTYFEGQPNEYSVVESRVPGIQKDETNAVYSRNATTNIAVDGLIIFKIEK